VYSDLPVPEPVAPSAGPLLAVLVARGPLAGVPDRFSIRHLPVSIGAGADRVFRLGDSSVSEDHAELSLEGGVWILRDRGSAAGTAVDGEPVAGSAVVAPGSAIRFGRVEVVLVPHDRWEHGPEAAFGAGDPPDQAPTEGPLRPRPVAPALLLGDSEPDRGGMWLLWAGAAVVVAAGLAIFFLWGG
jgi:hypothetical protein